MVKTGVAISIAKGTTTLSFFSLVFLFPWCFCFLGVSLVFLSVFCLFYRVVKGSHGEKNPWFFGGVFLGLFEKKKEKKAREGVPACGFSDCGWFGHGNTTSRDPSRAGTPLEPGPLPCPEI